ncbi:MAG: CoA ester lyase [Sphingomonadales bacterium]
MGCQDYPLRSVLYVPGDNPRALDKIAELNPDAVILDLEDGVNPDERGEARARIAEVLASPPNGIYLTVRVNPVGSEWVKDDLNCLLDNPPHAIVFPKIGTTLEMEKVEVLLSERGIDGGVKLWAMIETPIGVLNSREIAFSTPRLECLVMGTSDLVKDLHAAHTLDRSPVLYSLSQCVLAARARGMSIIDGVHIGLMDMPGYLAACQQGADLGFDGKTIIHPVQLKGANAAFGPDEKAIKKAEKIVAAFKAARKARKGVTVVDGKLVEILDVEAAERSLNLARKIAAKS